MNDYAEMVRKLAAIAQKVEGKEWTKPIITESAQYLSDRRRMEVRRAIKKQIDGK
jgi:hypothetical protein